MRIRNSESGIGNPDFGCWNSEFGIRKSGIAPGVLGDVGRQDRGADLEHVQEDGQPRGLRRRRVETSRRHIFDLSKLMAYEPPSLKMDQGPTMARDRMGG